MNHAEESWSIERIESAGTHQLTFSDVIAHEREDLVARAFEFLSAHERIEEVIGEDRELITLVGPELETDELRAEFHRWWNHASREKPPWGERMNTMAVAVDAVLRPIGFRKRGSVFNRQTSPDVVQVVELERIHHHGREEVRLDTGLFLTRYQEMIEARPRPGWVREYQCGIRDLLNSSRSEQSIALTDDPSILATLVEKQAVPVLERLRTVDELLIASEYGEKNLGFLANERLLYAVVLADLGRKNQARDILQIQFDRSNPRTRTRVLEWADRLDVALTTGKETRLSQAEEELLNNWTQAEDRRLTELWRLMEAHPVPNKWRPFRPHVVLDGSDRTIAATWRWLVDAAPQSDVLIPRPEPFSQRYRGWGTSRDADPSVQHLADLLAVLMARVVAFRQGSPTWSISDNGYLVLGNTEVLRQCEEAVLWAQDPPPTVNKPTKFNKLRDLAQKLTADH